MKNLLLLLLLTCYISPLYGGTIDPNTDDELYIKKATPFIYVGQISGTYEDEKEYMASAVAIDDHHILTAAHIVLNSKSVIFKTRTDEYVIDKIIIHHSFDIDQFGIADIALAYSKKSFELKNYPELYTESDETNKICTIVGYGLTGNFIGGANLFDSKLRAGNNKIDNIENDLLICDASRKTEHNFVDLEFFPACGDSGGGLFIDNKLAGINSCIFGKTKKLQSKYHEQSGHTRVSMFIEWIRNNKIK